MITAVRAKMVCNGTGNVVTDGRVSRVDLGAVYSNDKSENADFATATPWGSCTMGIDSGVPAASFFKPGKKYYVTFTEAPD
jgi:hypothetical protein